MQTIFENHLKEMKTVFKPVLKKIKEITIAKDLAKAKVEQLWETVDGYYKKIDSMNKRIADLRAKIPSLLSRSETPDSVMKEIRNIEAEVSDYEDWVFELENNVIPSAEAELSKAEKGFKKAIHEEVERIRIKKADELDELLADKVEAAILAWKKTIKEFLKPHGIDPHIGYFLHLRLNRTVKNNMADFGPGDKYDEYAR